VTQELHALAATARATFVPHLAPILAASRHVYFDLKGSLEQLRSALREFYAGQPVHTRIVLRARPRSSRATPNFCLVTSARRREGRGDGGARQLIKGRIGQGVECFNIAFGFDRRTALESTIQWP